MGFDIECIIDIQTYPGEYFCPVCRTLVYPNEAFQSQCTHLYCKPCLAHIANGTKACPYDGYLVTEADSKPLMDSDKTLAENIGKVKVHCLYFRSGCTWEGLLSECTSHCSACTFGNSPVICNRCGIQIVHRQVHEHAQSCPGMYGGQQATGIASATTRSVTTASLATSDANQTAQPVALQVQTSQIVAATPVPGQNPIQQVNVNSQAPATAPVNATTPDQWYQQQYQQYYQQYLGYYQQPNQQYYQFQQQPYQQFQQHPAQVPGQVPAQVVAQSVPQPHLQPQTQPQAQSQPQQQPHIQPQTQVQAQQQPQLHLPPPVQPQVQVQPQPQVPGQAPSGLAPNYQLNPQQPLHPPLRPQAKTLLPTPPNHSAQPPQFHQGIGMRPPAQPPQMPQYHQPPHQPSQFHVQPQMQPQPQPLSSNLSHVQTQPQVQPYPTPSSVPVFPHQANSAGPTALPQVPNPAPNPPPNPPALPVNGLHSYQQPNPTQKMQPGSLQQHPVHPHPVNSSAHPAQVHGQVPQQPGVMRPPAQVSLPLQQPSTVLPPQNQVPFIPPPQHQQFPPNVQQTHLFQNRPVMQPVQPALPPQYAHQQHFPAPLQSQYHQQLPIQPQLRPSAPAQVQPPLKYTGRPMLPNQGIHSQSHHPFSSDVGPMVQSGPVELSSTQMSTNQNYTKSTVLDHNETGPETRSPSRVLGEKSVEGGILKEKVVTGQSETIGKESDAAAKDVGNKFSIKQEEDNVHGLLGQASVVKTFEAESAANEVPKMDGHNVGDSDLLKQKNPENQKLSTAVGPSSANYDDKSSTAISASVAEGQLLPQQSQGSHLQRPEVQVQEQQPSVPGPQGATGFLPHPGQSLNPDERRTHGYYGPPRGFDPQSMTDGPAHPTQAYPHGVMGRMPLHEDQIPKDHIPGGANPAGMGEAAVAKAREPSLFRTNGGTTSELMVGSKDGKMTAMSREPLNSLPGDPTRPFDQASRSLDKVPHGPINEAGSKMNPSGFGPHPRFLPPHDPSGAHGNIDMFGQGPEFGQHHMKHFPRGSPGREYFGSSLGFGEPTSFPRGTPTYDDREPHRFGEGSRPFNLSSDRAGNPFNDGRFHPLSGHPQGDLGGSGNPRFGEHRAPGGDSAFGPDGPGNLTRGKFSGPGYFPGNFGVAQPAGPGPFPGHGRGRELGVPTSFPRPPFNESVRGDRFAHFGDPAMHNNYPLPGFPNAGIVPGGMNSFESWKRKPISNGWCRICEVDCESVEGLELHSQSREHQKRSMDMVKSIKLQNKKQRTGGPMMQDGGSRNRKTGIVGRGSNT